MTFGSPDLALSSGVSSDVWARSPLDVVLGFLGRSVASESCDLPPADGCSVPGLGFRTVALEASEVGLDEADVDLA